MAETLTPDICVIGAGAGGLSVAAGAVQMGASVVLIEGGKMGGDCLNYGCVPSKALLSSAHLAQKIRDGEKLGIIPDPSVPKIDFSKAKQHLRDVIADIEPHDSQERFEDLGVTVLRAFAEFVDANTVKAGDQLIKAKYVVISTGSRAAVPPINGLDQVDFLTNEDVFELEEAPAHLIVVGGGPIGVEMAQAHHQLGSKVTLLEKFTLMPRDDSELVDMLRHDLVAQGIQLQEQVDLEQVEKTEAGIKAIFKDRDGQVHEVEGSHLLIAAGRQPNVDKLNLEAAGIEFSPKGVAVDAHLKTNQKRIFAIGDAASGPQFTHVAGYHAGIIIRQILFKMFWAKVDYSALPWVTYTAPELAQVGLTEAEAKDKHADIRVLRANFAENDRARASAETQGLVKVIVTKKGKILGASIYGAQAGELIQIWALAISQGLKIGAIAGMIAPYPTMGEIAKRAAGSFYTESLFSEKTRKVVRFLMKWF